MLWLKFVFIAGSQFEKVSGKSRSSLISHVKSHLEGGELSELEDQGMAELLTLKDKIDELQQAAQSSVLERVASEANQTDVQEHVIQPLEGERLKKEIETLQLALALSLQEKPNQIYGTKQSVSG